MSEFARRSVVLDDAPLEVARSSDGRTITGYVAVHNIEAQVADMHGRYREMNAPTAFNKTVAERGNKFLVTYNHAMTLHGTPSSEFSVPLGVPTDVTIDDRGVRASIKIDRTPLGDAILEGARSGSIPGMSYFGTFVKSSPEKPRGGYRADRSGALPLVTRLEIAMRELGPTATPTYDAAEIIGVRALVASIEGLTNEGRAELIDLLQQGYELRSTTPEGEPADLDTPTGAVLADEPPAGHSARQSMNRIALRARALGVLK